LLDALRSSLADQSEIPHDTADASSSTANRANTRFSLPMAPAEAQAHWALARADEAMLGHDIAVISTLTDEELHALADQLHLLERNVSNERRQLHDRLDVLQTEIVKRYRAGEATVEGLLR
jgi:phage gp16-like protein